MSIILIVVAHTVSIIFFTVIIWKYGVIPFMLQYNRFQIVQIENQITEDMKKYPELKKELRTINAYLIHLYKSPNPYKIQCAADKDSCSKQTQKLFDSLNTCTDSNLKSTIMFRKAVLSMLRWYNPFLFFIFIGIIDSSGERKRKNNYSVNLISYLFPDNFGFRHLLQR